LLLVLTSAVIWAARFPPFQLSSSGNLCHWVLCL
jgi:hypothetical protein